MKDEICGNLKVRLYHRCNQRRTWFDLTNVYFMDKVPANESTFTFSWQLIQNFKNNFE